MKPIYALILASTLILGALAVPAEASRAGNGGGNGNGHGTSSGSPSATFATQALYFDGPTQPPMIGTSTPSCATLALTGTAPSQPASESVSRGMCATYGNSVNVGSEVRVSVFAAQTPSWEMLDIYVSVSVLRDDEAGVPRWESLGWGSLRDDRWDSLTGAMFDLAPIRPIMQHVIAVPVASELRGPADDVRVEVWEQNLFACTSGGCTNPCPYNGPFVSCWRTGEHLGQATRFYYGSADHASGIWLAGSSGCTGCPATGSTHGMPL